MKKSESTNENPYVIKLKNGLHVDLTETIENLKNVTDFRRLQSGVSMTMNYAENLINEMTNGDKTRYTELAEFMLAFSQSKIVPPPGN